MSLSRRWNLEATGGPDVERWWFTLVAAAGIPVFEEQTSLKVAIKGWMLLGMAALIDGAMLKEREPLKTVPPLMCTAVAAGSTVRLNCPKKLLPWIGLSPAR